VRDSATEGAGHVRDAATQKAKRVRGIARDREQELRASAIAPLPLPSFAPALRRLQWSGGDEDGALTRARARTLAAGTIRRLSCGQLDASDRNDLGCAYAVLAWIEQSTEHWLHAIAALVEARAELVAARAELVAARDDPDVETDIKSRIKSDLAAVEKDLEAVEKNCAAVDKASGFNVERGPD
jgi:hypothetical protein